MVNNSTPEELLMRLLRVADMIAKSTTKPTDSGNRYPRTVHKLSTSKKHKPGNQV